MNLPHDLAAITVLPVFRIIEVAPDSAHMIDDLEEQLWVLESAQVLVNVEVTMLSALVIVLGPVNMHLQELVESQPIELLFLVLLP